MRDAITSLLGSLPPLMFDARMTTTGDKLSALMLQLQMTGYMLRNAEYVMTLLRRISARYLRPTGGHHGSAANIDRHRHSPRRTTAQRWKWTPMPTWTSSSRILEALRRELRSME